MSAPFLLSIDLEDNRIQAQDGWRYPDRVALALQPYLELCRELERKITFFVVGETARKHAGLIRELIAEGHELACHSDDHVTLDRLDPERLRDNLRRNIDTLIDLGAEKVIGFRAPQLSLTKDTRWAWGVLAELGFRYSSSVLPARNPLFGFPEFGGAPRRVDGGLWEIPITLAGSPLRVPYASGLYLRALPKPALLSLAALRDRTLPLVSYLHPYDADAEQPRFAVMEQRIYNWLLYYNRRSTIPKLRALLSRMRTMRYRDYLAGELESASISSTTRRSSSESGPRSRRQKASTSAR